MNRCGAVDCVKEARKLCKRKDNIERYESVLNGREKLFVWTRDKTEMEKNTYKKVTVLCDWT